MQLHNSSVFFVFFELICDCMVNVYRRIFKLCVQQGRAHGPDLIIQHEYLTALTLTWLQSNPHM